MYYLRSYKNASPSIRSSRKASPCTRSSKKAPKASPSLSPEIPTTSLVSLLVSHIEGLKSLKPILKLLYMLLCSSLSYEICQSSCGNNAVRYGSNLKHEDTITLSGILFKELHKRLLSSSDDASTDADVGTAVIHFDVKDSGEEWLLLLRCCVLLVRLHPYDQVLTEQFRVVALLRRLSFRGISAIKERKSITFRLSTPIPQNTYHSCTKSSYLDLNAKSPDLYLRFVQQMQEVFLDEVFADRPFLDCIATSDSVSSTCQNMPVHSSIKIESVLEVIGAHFLLSIAGKDALYTVTERLNWNEKHALSSPEVSLLVASSLINHPVMKSAPAILFSHLISLVSEVIGIHVFPEKVGPIARCTQKYLSAFHDSVVLYCEQMSKLMTDFHSPGRIVRRPFEFYFHSEIYDRINFVLVDLDNAWREQSCRLFNKTISSVAIDAISYIKMNICIVDESYRDEAFSFLSSLITRLVSAEIDYKSVKFDEVLTQTFKEMTLQDFCLLASILKLMGCSLLQATRCSDDNLGSLIALLKRKADPMTFFSLYNFHVSTQVRQFIVDALKPHHSTYEEFELMFVHFSGLLSVCIISGLHILVKGCLFFMLVLVNALALELGSLEFLGQSVRSGTNLSTSFSQASVTSFVTTSSSGSFDISHKTPSFRVASNFQRERRMLFRDQTASEVSETSYEEMCNGEHYLKCVLKNRKDIDELADFIECKPWRDYEARLAYKTKVKHRRIHKYRKRLRMAKMQVHSSVRNGSKRKA